MKGMGPKRVLVETQSSGPLGGGGGGDVPCLATIVMHGPLAFGIGRATLLFDTFVGDFWMGIPK